MVCEDGESIVILSPLRFAFLPFLYVVIFPYMYLYIKKLFFLYFLEEEGEEEGHIVRSSPSSPDLILTPLRSVPVQADDGFATGKLIWLFLDGVILVAVVSFSSVILF